MVALFVVAFLLELAGLAVLVFEVWSANQRLTALRRRDVTISANTVVGVAMVASGKVSTSTPTLEDRLAALEADVDEHMRMHPEMEQRLRDHANKVASERADSVADSLRPEVERILRHILGEAERPWWRPWWLSPGLIVAGLVFGLVGNILSVT
jgi:hypothetical protein